MTDDLTARLLSGEMQDGDRKRIADLIESLRAERDESHPNYRRLLAEQCEETVEERSRADKAEAALARAEQTISKMQESDCL